MKGRFRKTALAAAAALLVVSGNVPIKPAADLFGGVAVTVSAFEIDHGTCGDNATWSLDDAGTLTISGTGRMGDFTVSTQPWRVRKRRITSVVIENGVTSIGECAFAGCKGLTSVKIPDSVTSIGDDAFYGCTNLTSIAIPDSVTSIGVDAFLDCTNITDVYCYADPLKLTWNDDRCNDFKSGKETTCYVPGKYLDNYNEEFGKRVNVTFKMNPALPGGKCGKNAVWEFDPTTHKLTISGMWYMDDFDKGAQPWKDYKSYITSVVIENGVTSIGEYAFYGCTNLTSVTISGSVTIITNGAFEGCTGLTSITLPDSVTSIGDHAFQGCTSLTSIKIPNSVTSIGGYAFQRCTSLKSITIPDSVTRIANGAFEGCASLTSVEVPNSVTSIGDNAFYGCTSLISVEIPNSVTSIRSEAFRDCTSLTSIAIPNSVTIIGDYAFRDCTSLTSIVISAKFTYIYDDAFLGCTNITDVYCYADPKNLTWNERGCDDFKDGKATNCYVPGKYLDDYNEKFRESVNVTFKMNPELPGGKCGKNARWEFDPTTHKLTISGTGDMDGFGGGTQPWKDHKSYITSVVIEDGVTSIGLEAFFGCRGLTSVEIPNSVTTIDSLAFCGCTGLTSVKIPDSVKSIGSFLFDDCTGLTSITIPNSVTSIDDYAFRGCTGLTSVEIPNSVESIGRYAFDGCTSLKSISIPDRVKPIGEGAFRSCISLTSVKIPDSVTSIGKGAFEGCTGLTSVEISKNVTSISDSAFRSCTNLTSIEIPDSVKTIGSDAFNGCTGLTSVTIPDSVTSIGDNAFLGCTNIKDVYCYADPKNLTWDERNCDDFKAGKETTCYVPGKYLDDYNENPNISVNVTFKMNPALPGGKCGENAVWDLDMETRKLTISGTGDMDDFGLVGQPWKDHKRYITSVVIEDGVTSTGNNAFHSCTKLTSIEIPVSVTSIGDYAFFGCTGLTSVTIPNSVTSIGAHAFSGCTGLTSITIPNSVTSIGSYAFFDCRDLTSVKIPDSVTSIDRNTFKLCSSLTSIVIPAKVTNIGEEAFLDCINITDVYCDADPKNLTWNEKDCNDFKPGKETVCHVSAEHLGYYQTNFSHVNVRFVTDVTVTVADGITNGTVTADKTEVYSGETVKLTVTPETGYAVKSVTVNGTELEAVNGVYSFTAPESDVIVSAEFEQQKCAVILPEHMEIINGDVLTEGKADYGTEIIFKVSDGYTASNVKNGETELIPDLSGIYTVTVEGDTVITADITEEKPFELKAYGLRLNGDIGLDVYFNIDDSVIKDVTRMVITLPNRQKETVNAPFKKEDNGFYRFSAKVAAKEMTDSVLFELYTNDTAPVCTADVSVRDAALRYLKDDYTTEDTLVRAMLNYGAYSQLYFGHNIANLANAGYEGDVSTVTAEELGGYQYDRTKEDLPTGLSFDKVNLTLESETSLNLYFTDNTGAVVSYTSDLGTVVVSEEKGFTKVAIKNIPAEELDSSATVTITVDGNSSYSVKYSPMTYCYNTLTRDNTDALRNCVRAFRLYNKEADAYITSKLF